MERAKRPYEGMEAYEAGRRDAIRDLYDELVRVDECLIINKDDIMKYLRIWHSTKHLTMWILL